MTEHNGKALMLPEHLKIESAKLPQTYEAAKLAITECERIDECAEWADRMAALISYARQVQDDSLEQAAKRIRGRAHRRCGELLSKMEPAKGGRPTGKLGPVPTQVSRGGWW